MYEAILLEIGKWAIRDNNSVNRLVRNKEIFTPTELNEMNLMALGVARFDTETQCREVVNKLNSE